MPSEKPNMAGIMMRLIMRHSHIFSTQNAPDQKSSISTFFLEVCKSRPVAQMSCSPVCGGKTSVFTFYTFIVTKVIGIQTKCTSHVRSITCHIKVNNMHKVSKIHTVVNLIRSKAGQSTYPRNTHWQSAQKQWQSLSHAFLPMKTNQNEWPNPGRALTPQYSTKYCIL